MAHVSHLDASLLPSPRAFYESEFGELGRPNRKGWALVLSGSPVRASKSKKSFFVNVQSGAFKDFGSDFAGGDLIAYVMQRYSINFVAACRRLGCWLEDMPSERARQMRQHQVEQEQRRIAEAVLKERAKRRRLEIREEIYAHQATINLISPLIQQHPDDDALWACLQSAVEAHDEAEQRYIDEVNRG